MKIINWDAPNPDVRKSKTSHKYPRVKNPRANTSMAAAVLAQRDLRSDAVDARRAIDSKTKWHTTGGGNPSVRVTAHGKERPQKPSSQRAHDMFRRCEEKPLRKQVAYRKLPALEGNSAKSMARKQKPLGVGDKENDDVDEVDVGVADVPLSYDAKGPQCGGNVLGAALDQAVAKYEDRKTKELVEHEYDVLETASDFGGLDTPIREYDEDDFEFV